MNPESSEISKIFIFNFWVAYNDELPAGRRLGEVASCSLQFM